MYSKNEYVLTSLNAPYEDPTKNNSKKRQKKKWKIYLNIEYEQKNPDKIYWEEKRTIFITKNDVSRQVGKDIIKTTTTLSHKKNIHFNYLISYRHGWCITSIRTLKNDIDFV